MKDRVITFLSKKISQKERDTVIKTFKRRQTRKDLKTFYQEFKMYIGCRICGYNRCPTALDFHHIGGKDKKVKNSSYGKFIVKDKKYMNELQKCVLVCKNCHREIESDYFLFDKVKLSNLVFTPIDIDSFRIYSDKSGISQSFKNEFLEKKEINILANE